MPAKQKTTKKAQATPAVETKMKMPEDPIGGAPDTQLSVLGPILAVLIILLVLLLGGLYLWSNTLQDPLPEPVPVERPTAEENNEPESNNAEAEVQTLETVSTSDEISAIEADLDSTNLDELDAELNAIDAELDAALQ